MWLHIPSTSLASVQERAGSNSDCGSPSETPRELYVTLSGKATLRPVSWRGWQTRPWMKLLCGTTLHPSTASLGVELWIASLRATRASRTVSPASVAATQISGTFGPTWRESLLNRGLPLSFWKTCQRSLLPGTENELNYAEWVTKLRQDFSLRQKWAHRIDGNGSSRWPTATVSSPAQTAENPTPGQTGGTTLLGTAESQKWATPRTVNIEGNKQRQQRGPNPSVASQAQTWGTPRVSDYKEGAAANYNVPTKGYLSRQAPRTPMPGDESLPQDPNSPQQWPTPCRYDSTPGGPNNHYKGLGNMAVQQKRKLNPLFVEWVMGWPIGWTGFDFAATEWCHWWRAMRSALCSLVCAET